jgi:hypothetical protein
MRLPPSLRSVAHGPVMELPGWVWTVLENGYFNLWIKVTESHDSPGISPSGTTISATGDMPVT